MGRDIYFSTGIEHKFWTGIQPSEDITKFYGEGDNQYDDDCGDIYQHQWEAKYDRERILAKLEKIQIKYNLPVIDWTEFPANTEGTEKLRFELFGIEPEGNLEAMAFYLLGAIIYHQLLYTELLSCQYET